uniref:Uncharacterized protein n=1 Tax=Pseudomonas phage HRDY3 TaxID=3236930 RepID=A0AB39CDM8_9VIRU
MLYDEFLEHCEKLFGSKIDKINADLTVLHSEVGTLRIEFSAYNEKLIDKIEFTYTGATLKFQPPFTRERLYEFEHIFDNIQYAYVGRQLVRQREIEAIEQYILQLEEIRKAPVEYKRDFDKPMPSVRAVLQGSDINLLYVYPSGIRYEPSGRVTKKTGGALRMCGEVAKLIYKPFTEHTKVHFKYNGSKRIDLFVSEGVRYVVPNAADGNPYIEVGTPNEQP